MIEIDASSGGGQMVRTALGLSCLTQKPFKMINIRKKRRGSTGLKRQHLTAIKILKEMTDAYTDGDELGSETLLFYPRKRGFHRMEVDIGSAGSITLVMQSILPYLISSEKRVTISLTGGTDVPLSMPYDYFKNMLIPQLQRYAEIDCELIARGYAPKGDGRINITVRKAKDINSLDMIKPQNLLQLKGIAHSSKDLMEREVAERMADAAKLHLTKFNLPINISRQYYTCQSTGCGIVLWAVYSENDETNINPMRIGADCLGRIGAQSENIGIEAATKLSDELESEVAVDKILADNLIPYIGMFGGRFKTSQITEHTKNNILVTEKFLDCKFNIENNIIEVQRSESQF